MKFKPCTTWTNIVTKYNFKLICVVDLTGSFSFGLDISVLGLDISEVTPRFDFPMRAEIFIWDWYALVTFTSLVHDNITKPHLHKKITNLSYPALYICRVQRLGGLESFMSKCCIALTEIQGA